MAALTVPPEGEDSCCPFAHRCAPRLRASPVSGEGLGNRSRFCLFREYPVCTSPQPSKQHALHALRPESWEASHHRRMLLHSLVAVICNSIHPPTPTPFSKAFPSARPPRGDRGKVQPTTSVGSDETCVAPEHHFRGVSPWPIFERGLASHHFERRGTSFCWPPPPM